MPEDTHGREAVGGPSMLREKSSGVFNPQRKEGHMSQNLLESPFPAVVMQPVYWGKGQKVFRSGRYQAVVDEKTNKLFSIVSSDYKLLRHEAAIEEIEKAIGATQNLGGYDVSTAFFNDGGRMLREYVFHDHPILIQRGDLIKPKLQLFNSYDLTWSFTVILGAYRLVCTNGLVVGEKLFHLKKRHVFHFETLNLVGEISTALTRFSKQAEEWKKWADLPLSKKACGTILETMALGKNGEEEINNTMDQEAAGFDRENFPIVSLWIFFNILTWYITHRAASLNHRVAMEGRLRKAMADFRRR